MLYKSPTCSPLPSPTPVTPADLLQHLTQPTAAQNQPPGPDKRTHQGRILRDKTGHKGSSPRGACRDAGPALLTPAPGKSLLTVLVLGVMSPFCSFSCPLRSCSGQLCLGKAKKPGQVKYLISTPVSLMSGFGRSLGLTCCSVSFYRGGNRGPRRVGDLQPTKPRLGKTSPAILIMIIDTYICDREVSDD